MDSMIAILPMRAGSQRVKDKNIRLIGGKPLYEYILNTLLKTDSINKVVINTDINEVLDKYADNDKIILVEREESLKGNCSMNLVIADTLKKVEGEHFIQVHATSPLVKATTIDKAIKKYLDNIPDYDNMFSVTRIQKRFWNEDATPNNHDPKEAPTTQDLKPLFEENSCFYIFNQESFMKNKNRIGEKPMMYETTLVESMDIDTEDELKIVEALLSK